MNAIPEEDDGGVVVVDLGPATALMQGSWSSLIVEEFGYRWLT